MDPNPDLRTLLETLSPSARDKLRRVLVMDQADRDVVAARLMRFRDETGDGLADAIDLLSLHPELRRRVARLLPEIDAAG